MMYWMWDPSLVSPSSPGWSNYSQDQVCGRALGLEHSMSVGRVTNLLAWACESL